MAIFFTIVIVGLSAGLGGSVSHSLAVAQVGPPDQGILTQAVAANPTGALFGAFLGENPMGPILDAAAKIPGWQTLPNATLGVLTAPHFFAQAIQSAFGSALSLAFLFAAAVTGASAAISAFRGERYIHEESPAPAGTPPSGDAPAPVGPVRSRP